MSSARADMGERGAPFTRHEERPFPAWGVRSGPRVEELQERIARLVLERERLRASGARHSSLERNRLQIVRSHWQLSRALIERHLPRARAVDE
jgi:hypothetical protein